MVQLTLSERVARLENFAGLEPGSFVTEREMREKENEDFQRAFEQSAPKPARTDQTAFEEIIHRISSCNDRVCLTADKLQKIGDRIMGALPETANGDDTVNPRRGPDGTLDHTFMALNWLDQSLSRLEQVALRMECV